MQFINLFHSSNQLLKLINSNFLDPELLKKVITLVNQYFPSKTNHSIFFLDQKRISTEFTTLTDPDELYFLKNQLQQILVKNQLSSTIEGRLQATYSRTIPLFYANQRVGFWVIDFYQKKPFKTKFNQHFTRLVTFFLTMYWLKRKEARAYYMDSSTSLPDRRYLMSYLQIIREQRLDGCLCLIQCEKESSNMDHDLVVLSLIVKRLNIGTLCRMNDNTLALLIFQDLVEAYDQTSLITDMCQIEVLVTKILLFRFSEMELFLSKISSYFDHCKKRELLVIDSMIELHTPLFTLHDDQCLNPITIDHELLDWIQEDIEQWR